MFDIANPTSFQYYLHFTIFYTALLAMYIGLKMFRRQMDKNKKLLRKIVKNYAGWLLFISICGYIFLLSRYANIYFFSMEFMHLLALSLFTLSTIYYLIRLKIGYKIHK